MSPCAASLMCIHLPRGGSIRRLSPCSGALVLLVLLVLLVFVVGGLVGCGVATDKGTTATNTRTATIGCPGGLGAGTGVAAPALVLTIKDASHESRAHVGEVIQVRLPATQRWTLGKGGEGGLMLLQPAGYWDERLSTCVWNFKADKAGATTVRFVGTAICEPEQMCPAYAVDEEFSIAVV